MAASKRLYEATAHYIKHARSAHEDDLGALSGIHSAARAVAQAFKEDNPRFDVDRFLTACEVE